MSWTTYEKPLQDESTVSPWTNERSLASPVIVSSSPLIAAAPDMVGFFDRLAYCVWERNPDIFRGGE